MKTNQRTSDTIANDNSCHCYFLKVFCARPGTPAPAAIQFDMDRRPHVSLQSVAIDTRFLLTKFKLVGEIFCSDQQTHPIQHTHCKLHVKILQVKRGDGMRPPTVVREINDNIIQRPTFFFS